MRASRLALKDISVKITKGTTPTTMGRPFVEEGINFIKAEALNGDTSLDRNGFAFIDEGTHQLLQRSILEKQDILVTIAGANTGKCGLVREADLPANTNQAVGIVRINHESAEPRFVYYFFKQKRTFDYIQTLSAQSAQPNLNLTNLGNIRVSLPPREVQTRIASILSAYDDLIENNRRRIQLLEQAARMIYKEWFVRLRFPGHEHVKVKNGVPEEWERKSFSHLAVFLNGFAFKPSHLGDVGLPIVKIPELREGPTAKTPRNTGDDIPENYLLDNGDILFSWSGTLLVNMWNHGKALLNQHLFKVTPISHRLRGLVYFALNQALVEFQNQTTGATMKHIRKDALEKVCSVVPDAAILEDFEATVSPVLGQIGILQRQITEATKARDMLLPRLMNGDLQT